MPKTVFNHAEERMKKSIEVLKHEFAGVRTGRANPAMLDRIVVNYYGSDTPLKQLATINVPEARQLAIKPFDRSTISSIEKAILNSDLGINPSNDGEVIRLNIPALTEERRKEMVKLIKKMAEEQKVAIRNIRRDANDALKKLEITEDQEKKALEDIQKLTDKFIKNVDDVTKEKEQEILTV